MGMRRAPSPRRTTTTSCRSSIAGGAARPARSRTRSSSTSSAGWPASSRATASWWASSSGFICPDAAVGYVHLVGIHPDYRRRGVGQAPLRVLRGRLPARGLPAAQGDHHARQRGQRPLPPGPGLGHGRDRGLRRPRPDAHRVHPKLGSSATGTVRRLLTRPGGRARIVDLVVGVRCASPRSTHGVTLFLAVATIVLASASCAQGSPFVGTGGGAAPTTTHGRHGLVPRRRQRSSTSPSTSTGSSSGACSESPCKLPLLSAAAAPARSARSSASCPRASPPAPPARASSAWARARAGRACSAWASGTKGICNQFCDTDARLREPRRHLRHHAQRRHRDGVHPQRHAVQQQVQPRHQLRLRPGHRLPARAGADGPDALLHLLRRRGHRAARTRRAPRRASARRATGASTPAAPTCASSSATSAASAPAAASCSPLQDARNPIIVDGVTVGVCP